MSALVDELRVYKHYLPAGLIEEDYEHPEICDRAAAELTTLQSRLEEKEAAWGETRKAVAALNNENGQLRSRLEAVEAERDEWRATATEFKELCTEWHARAEELEKALAELREQAASFAPFCDLGSKYKLAIAQADRALSPARTEPDLSKGGEE